MGSKPVRVPEEKYEAVRDVAAKLNVPLSEATGLALETGLENLNMENHLVLDADLAKKRRQILVDASSDMEIIGKENKLYQRQADRNWERSDLTSSDT
jgi:hypothetical protein